MKTDMMRITGLVLTISMMGGAALAQTAPTVGPVATETAVQGANITLPPALKGLVFEKLTVTDGRRGDQVVDALYDGKPIRMILDQSGALRGVMVRDGAIPGKVLDAVLPQNLRQSPNMAEFAAISGVRIGEKGTGLRGTDAQGKEIKAAFSQDARLYRFSRDDEMEHDGDRHEKHGKKGHKDRHGKGKWGERGKHGKPLLDEDSLRRAAEQAGYTDLGEIVTEGPRHMIKAKNPQGEDVLVTIGPKGEVVRETAR